MSAEPVELTQWPERLERVIEERCSIFKRIFVLKETDSTQDAARRMDAKPGDVIIAFRQTAGRGRLGRSWSSGIEGVAITFVIEPDRPERLAIAAAIGAAQAAEAMIGGPVGIKWPNDIMVNDRKLAGVLVEQNDRIALPAVGMNVLQASWPEELANKAISLNQLGIERDRIEVAAALLEKMDRALRLADEELIEGFCQRDWLKGRWLRLRCGSEEIEGRILRIDPMLGLEIETKTERRWLEAAATTLLEAES